MEFKIGVKIKKLRKARKLTLQEVARETGFSPALISQIENNNVSPPIATLAKLARFFDVKMAHFFEEEEEYKYEVVRKSARRIVNRVMSKAGTGHGYTYEALSFRKHNKKMEPFLVTLSEGPGEEMPFNNHEGEEFLLVLKGTAEILLDEERIILEEGDAIYFDSSLRHQLLSHDGQEVQVLAIVTR